MTHLARCSQIKYLNGVQDQDCDGYYGCEVFRASEQQACFSQTREEAWELEFYVSKKLHPGEARLWTNHLMQYIMRLAISGP